MSCLISGCFRRSVLILSYLRVVSFCNQLVVVGSDVASSSFHPLYYQCPVTTHGCDIRIQTTSMVAGCPVTVCIPYLRNYTAQNTNTSRCNTTTVVYTIARYMGWTTLLVIYGNTTEADVMRENDSGSRERITVTLVNINVVETQAFSSLISSEYQASVEKHKYLNVLVMCSQQGLQALNTKVAEFKKTLPRFTAFDLWSTWLIGLHSGMSVVFEKLQLTLTNLATITFYQQDTPTRCTRQVRDECDVFNTQQIDQKNMFPKVIHGLNNMKLTVATLPSTTFVVRTIQDGGVLYKGLCIDILDLLSTALHFSYTIIEPKDGLWGKEIEKGTYNGIVGEILNQEIDLIAAPLIPRQDRVDVMDFTVPYFWDRVVVIFQKPAVDNTKWKTLLNPFRGLVFVCIGLSMIFVVLFVSFMEFVNPFYEVDKTRTCRRLIYRFSWYVYGSLLRQGVTCLPESLTGRMVLGSWFLFCTITAAAYCTNLVAFLSVNKETLKYKNVADLLRDDSLQWGAQGNYYFTMLKQGQDKRLWASLDEKHKSALLDRDEDLHEAKVREGKFVFVAHYHHVHAWAVHDCTLQLIVPALSVPVLYTFGFPLHSDFTDLFSVKLMEITESGLLDESLDRSNKQLVSNMSCEKANTESRSIDLEDLQTAFYILCAGVVLSVMSLVVETWTSNICNTGIVQMKQTRKNLYSYS